VIAVKKKRTTGAGSRSLALPDGGRASLAKSPGGEETLQVLASGGEVRVEIVFSPSGPVVKLAGARVAIEAEGALAIRCASFEVTAETIALGASGNLTCASGAALDLRAGHDASLSAQAVRIEGRRGEIALTANDDVTLNGERVLLNCPTDEEVERQRQAATTLADHLALPFQPPGSPRRLPSSLPVPEGNP